MQIKKILSRNEIIFLVVSLIILYLMTLYSYLLFHTFVEIFSIVIAFFVFIIGWNTRDKLDNNYILFISISYLFVGMIDLVHTIAFKGMGIFIGYDANLPTQLWINARYLEAFSLLFGFYFLKRKINYTKTMFIFSIIFSLMIFSSFFGYFPDCLIEGEGLTPFKIISEYIIIGILFVSLLIINKYKNYFDSRVNMFLSLSIIITIISEFMFTLYGYDVYGIYNEIGHYLKIVSFYFIYKAIIELGIKEPYKIIFRNLKNKEKNLEQLNEDLKKSNQQKNDYMGILTHEIKTPIHGIRGFIEMLLKTDLSFEQKEYTDMIRLSAKNLSKLIDDVLDYSKIESGKMVLEKNEFNLNLLINEIKNLFIPDLKIKKLSFETNIENIPNILFGDEYRIKQILINLIGNAVKFTQEGYIKLNVNSEKLNSGKIKINFVLEDSGTGISKNNLNRIFERYNQEDSSIKKRFGGTGLGLYITKKIIEHMDGEISVKSEKGQGSKFIFYIVL